ncbi:tRNA glutamyl-Q(34) synthetase GluQRS [Roseovarius sp. CAU 1744]|uniref:tRNA glutamyl-Q(34) synthetase GluQRS n=1 Tax=Roseovarius sp. CAU 1744 TaxID=3140368 RepID=UPI00325AB73D
MTFTTRFAPSPTGPLHLGHAYSALLAHDMAMSEGGDFLLRIDDLDATRSRPEWEDQLKSDLAWLGLRWPTPCRRESDSMAEYDAALDRLWSMGLLYPCTCSRRDIREALSAPQEGPDGLIYPGTCREKRAAFPRPGDRPRDVTLRLDMAQACRMAGVFDHQLETPEGGCRRVAGFTESGAGPAGDTGRIEFTPEDMCAGVGDVVLARKDVGAAYHLAVVIDDDAQKITHVIRGQDLFEATRIHVVLQHLLGLPTPVYHHHRLIRDEAGKRLAKRDDARAIARYRDDGASPQDIRDMVGLG